MVAAIQPTDELRRHFAGVQRAGFARTAGDDAAASLPSQSLKSWRGADGMTAAAWAKSAIDDASEKFSSSIGEDELEVFGAKARTDKSKDWEPAWRRSGDGHAYTWHGVGMFRAQLGKAAYRYFLGKRKDKAVFLEGPAVHEVTRMQFGLAALHGYPFHPVVAPAKEAATIRLPLSAPTTVRRLLVALCDEVPGSFGRTWTCRRLQCMPALIDVLKELSGEVVERE